MGCASCGDNMLDRKLGKCAYCIRLALSSSLFFWGVSYALLKKTKLRVFVWPVVSAASLFSLLSTAHVLAFLTNRRKNAQGDASRAD
jgi:hypothetical protein